MIEKRKRKIDRDLLDYIKTLPCEVCGKGNCDPSHVTTVGAGGDDSIDNVMPLCREHHGEWHRIGKITFIKKYRSVELWMRHHNRKDLLAKLGE